MLKLIIGFLSMAFFTFIGKCYADKLKKSSKTLADLSDFNGKVITAVEYLKDDICSVASKTEYKSELGEVFKKTDNLKQKLQKDKYVFKTLNKEQRDFAVTYINNLGTSDESSQLTFLKNAKEKFSSWQETAETKVKKMSPIYIKIGFLAGLIIFIILL